LNAFTAVGYLFGSDSVRPSKTRKQKEMNEEQKIKLHEVKNWNYSSFYCMYVRERERERCQVKTSEVLETLMYV